MTPGDAPDVIPSEVDPAYDCVRLGSTSAEPDVAQPPPGGHEGGGPGLCPEGYVPRRRRAPYRAEGKHLVSEKPPEHNPKPPPAR